MLAANTSFSAFPRLSAVLASDNFLPRRFAYRGDRLAFTAGIVVLGVLAGILIVIFGGDTHALIPLYAVGVFIDFTISQTGMIRHWLRERPPGFRQTPDASTPWARSSPAWWPSTWPWSRRRPRCWCSCSSPSWWAIMWFIHHEYDAADEELEVDRTRVYGKPTKQSRVIIPVPTLSRAVLRSVQFGRSLSDDVTAVHITIDAEAAEALREDWEHMLPDVPLVIIETPYRSLVLPFLHYLDVMAPTPPNTITIVVLPEYVPRHWWDRLLHNQKAHRIREALVGRYNTVVAEVPYGGLRSGKNGNEQDEPDAGLGSVDDDVGHASPSGASAGVDDGARELAGGWPRARLRPVPLREPVVGSPTCPMESSASRSSAPSSASTAAPRTNSSSSAAASSRVLTTASW